MTKDFVNLSVLVFFVAKKFVPLNLYKNIMAKRLLTYKGLFGDNIEPFGGAHVHYEPLQKRTLLYNYEITEHLHTNLVQVFLITSGGGLLLSAGRKISLETPCVLIIPSNTLHGFVFQSEVKGEVFTIPEVLFEKFLKNAPSVFSTFDQLQHFSFDPGTPLFLALLDLKNKIIRELQHHDKTTEFALSLLFQLFLLKLHRSKEESLTESIDMDNRTLSHFHTFKKLIKLHIHEGKSVQFYAREMNLTTVHLNRICKAVAQKTALQIIHEYVLQEAKKYLKGTSYSIAEIAYFLDFKDPAHFSKFFKKKEGITPGAFRK